MIFVVLYLAFPIIFADEEHGGYAIKQFVIALIILIIELAILGIIKLFTQ